MNYSLRLYARNRRRRMRTFIKYKLFTSHIEECACAEFSSLFIYLCFLRLMKRIPFAPFDVIIIACCKCTSEEKELSSDYMDIITTSIKLEMESRKRIYLLKAFHERMKEEISLDSSMKTYPTPTYR